MNTYLHNICKAGAGLALALACTSGAWGTTHQMEQLNRGVVAIKKTGGVMVTWRFLGTDKSTTSFNLYRDGVLVNSTPLTSVTNYLDANGTTSSTYTVKAVNSGTEGEASAAASVWSDIHKEIQLQLPTGGTDLSGNAYTYTPNDMSVGDLDGDGDYELVVKWDPSDSKDNSSSGYTGNVYLDAYEIDGTFMWRIDLGINVRAGAHYTQYLVYDFDGDGKAEVVCRTAPGTIDGKGNAVLMGSDSKTADYRNSSGYVLSGNEYLTVFEGATGANLATEAFDPARGTVSNWGDSYGNRVDRFLATVAYVDGERPSIIMSRGYYARAGMSCWNYRDGKLTKVWNRLDTSSGSGLYGEGFHSLFSADVDKDGKDEIIFGSACVDDDGSLYYRKGFGHGDAMHISQMCTDCDLYGWFVHEESSSQYGYELRNLRTGDVIFGKATGNDNGRGIACDLSATNPGFEMWSVAETNVYDVNGNTLSSITIPTGVGGGKAINFRIYWDGDLQDELLDRNLILDEGSTRLVTMSNYGNGTLINGTKYNALLVADILGDWREEFITYNSSDPSKINIMSTDVASDYRLPCLMHDRKYRCDVASQNVSYNQPPHLSYYIGEGISNVKMPDIYTISNGVAAPTLAKHGAGSSSQSVQAGESITEFSFEWANATTVTVSGLPDGITASINTTAKSVTFSGSCSVEGTYVYTVTTVSGYDPEATKSGTFVIGSGVTVPDTAAIYRKSGDRNQTIIAGQAMQTTTYTYVNADSLVVVGTLPEGVVRTDNYEGTMTISGTPHEIGTFVYTLQTMGNNVNVSGVGGTLTVIEDTTVSKMTAEGELSQVVFEGENINDIVVSYGAGTKSVAIYGLTDGLTATTDEENKTVTISGAPNETAELTIISVGNGEVISLSATITVIPSGLKRVAYVTNPTAANYANDTKILPALKACTDLYVQEVDALQSEFDFSGYDVLVISEVPGSAEPLMLSLKDVKLPILNMKVFEYKTSDATWSWATTGYGDDYSQTNITVQTDQKSHPIFNGLTLDQNDELDLVSAVSTKALSYMYPSKFNSVENGDIETIAVVSGTDKPVIFEAPSGTCISGTTLACKYLQVGLNSSSYANISDNGAKLVVNSVYYLLDMIDLTGLDKVQASQKLNIAVYPMPVEDESAIRISAADGTAGISIFNTTGQLVWSATAEISGGGATVPLVKGSLPAGIYTLTVNNGYAQATEKIIVK